MSLKKTRIFGAAIVASAIMGGTAFFATQEASATAISLPRPAVVNSDVQQVAWVYIPSKHGQRLRHKHGRYHYFYHGYWYASPFWLQLGPITLGLAPRPWTPAWYSYCEHKYAHFDHKRGKYRRGGVWYSCR